MRSYDCASIKSLSSNSDQPYDLAKRISSTHWLRSHGDGASTEGTRLALQDGSVKVGLVEEATAAATHDHWHLGNHVAKVLARQRTAREAPHKHLRPPPPQNGNSSAFQLRRGPYLSIIAKTPQHPSGLSGISLRHPHRTHLFGAHVLETGGIDANGRKRAVQGGLGVQQLLLEGVTRLGVVTGTGRIVVQSHGLATKRVGSMNEGLPRVCPCALVAMGQRCFCLESIRGGGALPAS